MKTRNKLITGLGLTVGTIAGTALLNKYLKMKAVARNLLCETHPHCFKWRLGDIHYTKTGTGKPLLLIHDLTHASSGAEWEPLIPMLKDHYTIYTIDLLGCGRSEKPNLTYTNFLYVQLISDFIKSEIGRRTNVVATGASASLLTMACAYNPDLFDQMMFINPESFTSCAKIPGKRARAYKFILDTPILGTLLYNIAAARDTLDHTFKEKYFYNPYEARLIYIDKFFESAHLGLSPKAIYASVACNYTKCNIARALEKINNSIYILGGGAKEDINETIHEYSICNPSIESSIVAATKHLPHLEKTEEVSNIIKMFFN